MRKLFGTLALAAIVALCAVPDLYAQQFVLSNTTLSAAITDSQQTITLTSASASSGSNVGAPAVGHGIYIADNPGEFLIITSVSGTTYGVRRAQTQGSIASAHVSGAVVLTGPQGNFFRSNPGSNVCVASSVPRPWVNIQTGEVGLCKSSIWTWTSKKVITYSSIDPY